METSASEDSRQRGSNKPRTGGGASSVSSGVRLENISKSFKGVTVLKDVSWEVKKGEKVGLVGVNGAGKMTQMRIIAGEEEPDSGNLLKAKPNMKIAFLSQEFEVCQTRTVKEEFLSAFKEEMEIAGRLERVQKALEGSVDDLELMGRLLDELDLLQRRAQDVDLNRIDARISKMMPELGFAMEDSERLVVEPDLLLLDEPTNHLDIDSTEWLEGYLNKQDVPMVIISHDRAFLDLLCTKIVETDMGKLEKLQDEDQVEKPFQRKQIRLRFPERGRSGRCCLITQISLSREVEKIAIIGPNGCGKSTLLKLIMGLEKCSRGEVLLGEHNVLPNYFEQNQAEALDLGKTVLETVEEVAEDWRLDDIKGLLGRCNFKADMLDRKVSLLSGGEKARLAFCKFMVKPSTLLIVDEPTNHLDIPTKEMLEEAISEYQGTVITVSHDHYFIKQIDNRVVEVKDRSLQDYAGDYNYYLGKNLEARERELECEFELQEKAPKFKSKSTMSEVNKFG
ncbi:ABC transporter F family member 5 [Acorus gramineus]|uniref:ABC transporter F family member 5 n=1 Tax=Acorus gramineus TaxID=55184 RepID=A0AAV9AU78_ACOGR|nr:ABC transporter F family member 5 [Acorus gramineus]